MTINIVISTGAGISAESGIHTYRDLNGLWTKFNPIEVSHIKGWNANPQKVLDFKNMLRAQFKAGNYKPNAAHYALTKLQNEWTHGEVTIITQNIDGLHVDAGSKCYEIHGTGKIKFCEKCGDETPYDSDIILSDPCRKCGETASIRPKVVLFGEMPYDLDIVQQKLDECHIYIVIGSSLEVMPGSLFVYSVKEHNAETMYINLQKPDNGDLSPFDYVVFGPATEKVTELVENFLKS